MKKIIVLLIFCIGCQSSSKKVILPEKMVSILKDMHIVQSYLYEQKYSNQERIQRSKQLYHSILAKYRVSKEEFYQSMDYYSEHVQELDSIYKLVIENSSIPSQH